MQKKMAVKGREPFGSFVTSTGRAQSLYDNPERDIQEQCKLCVKICRVLAGRGVSSFVCMAFEAKPVESPPVTVCKPRARKSRPVDNK